MRVRTSVEEERDQVDKPSASRSILCLPQFLSKFSHTPNTWPRLPVLLPPDAAAFQIHYPTPSAPSGRGLARRSLTQTLTAVHRRKDMRDDLLSLVFFPLLVVQSLCVAPIRDATAPQQDVAPTTRHPDFYLFDAKTSRDDSSQSICHRSFLTLHLPPQRA